MTDVKLLLPSEEYLQSFLEVCKEFKQNNVTLFSLRDPDIFDEWKDTIFHEFAKARNGIDLKPGYVPCTTFWMMEGKEVVGIGNLRHMLTPELERGGGHIGYAIRVSKWNRGYGTIQLKLLLKEANKLGIGSALLTCNDTNVGSYRVMEKNGGKHWDTIESVVDGQVKLMRRYWIETNVD